MELCPETKTKRFKPPAPRDARTWDQILADDARRRREAVALAAAVRLPDAVRAPQVPARPPGAAGEFASWQGKQAAGLGRRAAEAGWDAEARYWRAGDGSEGCAVRLRRADVRAVATWRRRAGQLGAESGWKADVAYLWREPSDGRFPTNVTHMELQEFITQNGRPAT